MKSVKFVGDKICTACGVCVGSCPKGAISLKINEKGQYLPHVDVNRCVDCGLCLDVCANCYNNIAQRNVEIYDDKRSLEKKTAGHILEAYVGLIKDVRLRDICTSGGFVTQIVKSLLEVGKYDLAFLVKGHEYGQLVKTSELLSSDDIMETPKSRYISVSHEDLVSYILHNRNKKVIIVGVGCAIKGIYNVINKFSLKRDNYLLLGLKCWMTFNYSIIDYYKCYSSKNFSEYHFRSKVNGSVAPGDVRVIYEDGSDRFWPHSSWTILKPYLSLEHCFYCEEHMNTKCDITFADNWSEKASDANQHSGMMIIRTKIGKDVFEFCRPEFYAEQLSNQEIFDNFTKHAVEVRQRIENGILFEKQMNVKIYPSEYVLNYDYERDANIRYRRIRNRMKNKPSINKIRRLYWFILLKQMGISIYKKLFR